MNMNWSVIRNFGKVNYFNVSYAVIIIVPLLANTMQMINDEFNYALHVPPMVKSLYLASILYAIGIAIYQYRCPPIIKEYENKQAYLRDNVELFKNKAPDLKLHIVLAQLNKETQYQSRDEIIALQSKLNRETPPGEAVRIKAELDEKIVKLYEGSVQTYLEKNYDADNRKEPISYWLSGLFYFSGTAIIIYLLIIRTLIVFNT